MGAFMTQSNANLMREASASQPGISLPCARGDRHSVRRRGLSRSTVPVFREEKEKEREKEKEKVAMSDST
jgi:hypothetical protein